MKFIGGLLGRFKSTGMAIFWLVLFALTAATSVYWVGKREGKTQVREETAQYQAKVTQWSIKTQQRDRKNINDHERSLTAQRYTYETIIDRDPAVHEWADKTVPDCVFELSAATGLPLSNGCEVPARPNPDSTVGDSGRRTHQR